MKTANARRAESGAAPSDRSHCRSPREAVDKRARESAKRSTRWMAWLTGRARAARARLAVRDIELAGQVVLRFYSAVRRG